MANDLAETRLWLQALLMDVGAKSWDTTALDMALRLALFDVSRAGGVDLTLKDLDGAAATTLTGVDRGSLIIGASAYAARSRALDLSENASLSEKPMTTMLAFAKEQMDAFKDQLEKMGRHSQLTSSSAPHGALFWDDNDDSLNNDLPSGVSP